MSINEISLFTNYIVLALLSSALFAVVNIVDKIILSKFISNPWIPIHAIGIIGGITSVCILFYTGIPSISISTFCLIILSAFLNLLAAYFYIKALMIDDVSKLIPLFFLTPLLTLPFSYLLLNESYSPNNLIGIFFLIVGGLLITLNDRLNLVFNKALLYILLSLLCTPMYMSITKLTSQEIDPLEYFAIMRIAFFVLLFPVLFSQRRTLISTYRHIGKKVCMSMAGNQIINSAGIIISISAVSIGKVAIVSALSALQPLLVLIVSYILFRYYPNVATDKMTKRTLSIRFSAVVLLSLGTYLVSTQ